MRIGKRHRLFYWTLETKRVDLPPLGFIDELIDSLTSLTEVQEIESLGKKTWQRIYSHRHMYRSSTLLAYNISFLCIRILS